MVRWRERVFEDGCQPSTALLDELQNVCPRMLDKYDALFTIASFDWADPGSPMKLVIFVYIFLNCHLAVCDGVSRMSTLARRCCYVTSMCQAARMCLNNSRTIYETCTLWPYAWPAS